jgi:hypothetical protein
MASTFSGPSAREMLQSHTLAKEIIARNDKPDADRVLDDGELSLLRRWCAEPAAKEQILAEKNVKDAASAQQSGSLVGYLMAQSVAGNELVTKEEFENLQEWFKSQN